MKNTFREKYIKFIVYFVLAVMLNFAGIKMFFRIDLTSNGLYSLSDASKEAVATLKEPLTINVFFSKNLPAPYNNIERYLKDLMEEYSIYSNSNFNYSFFNVTAQEGDLSEEAGANRKKAQSFGIYPVNVQKIEQDETKVQRAYMGIAFVHGDITEKIPAVISTEGLEYKITTTIQKMNNKISKLLSLDSNIRVTLVKSDSLNQIAKFAGLQGTDKAAGLIRQSVEELKSETYGKIEFHEIADNSSADKTVINKFRRFFLNWQAIENKDVNIPAGSGGLALGISYKGRSFEMSLLRKTVKLTQRGLAEQFELEDMKKVKSFIKDNIDTLISVNDDIGYLVSHDSLSIHPAPPQMQQFGQNPQVLKKFRSLVSQNYDFKNVDLKVKGIAEGIQTLIIAGPKGNFSDWELFQIDQFLMKGKSIAVFADSFREVRQQQGRNPYAGGFNQPVYLPLNTGLEKLLKHYGISAEKSYVMDKSCYVNRDPRQGEMKFYYAPVIKNQNINHEFEFLKNIKGLIAIKSSPLTRDNKVAEKAGLKISPLFNSSSESWEMKGRINLMPFMIKPPADKKEFSSFNMAVIAEGEFTSYFADKAIPAPPVKKEEVKGDKKEKADSKEKKEIIRASAIKSDIKAIKKGRPGKILLIGSSDILKDNVLDDNGVSPNAVFLLNTIDYLNGNEEVAVMRAKNQKFNPVKDMGAGKRNFIKVLNIAGLPLIFVIAGIFVWLSRQRRRKHIQDLFNKKEG